MAKKAYVYDGSAWQDLSSSISDLSQYANLNTYQPTFRNVLINGDFRINQRGLTSTGITTTYTYGFDRWYMGVTGNGTSTYSAQAFLPGNAIPGYEPTNYARIVTTGQTGTNPISSLAQRVEDVRTFAGQTVTLSFWAKATTGTPKVAVQFIQRFGSGGTPSSDVSFYAGQVTLSTSWTRYSITTTFPSISGKSIGTTANSSYFLTNIIVSAGSDYNSDSGSLGIQSNTFDFWGVQLERGSVATPFEQRPIGTELALCQRYYWRSASPATAFNSYGYGSSHGSTTDCYFVIKLARSMRTKPTAVEYSNLGVATNGSGVVSFATLSIADANPDFATVLTSGSTGLTTFRPYSLNNSNNVNGYLAFSAEL